MANGGGGYGGGGFGTIPFIGSLISGISSLMSAPIYAPKPTHPAQSQILIGRNASFVSDPASPATATHPAGYALADTWFNPYDPVVTERRPITQTVMVPDPISGVPRAVVQTVGYDTIQWPKFYSVKSAYQEDQVQPPAVGASELFRSPESETINSTLCDPSTSQAAATAKDRLNRLTNNQFFSPFRSRRAGGNSYQALSEAQDNLFTEKGNPGDFSPEVMPAFIQRRPKARIFRG